MNVRFAAYWCLVFALAVSPCLLSAEEPAVEPAKAKPVEAKDGAADKKPADGKTPDASAERKADDEYYELYRSLADTLDQVERNYVKPIDRRELMESAIKGVLGKLDPYSSYIGREEMTGFRNSVESQFGGIGIQITVEDGQIKVTSPLVGTPAYRAGIQSGDKIVKIEGEPAGKLTLDEAVRKLKGEVGSAVNLTVQHALSGKTDTYTIKRELIHIDTVLGDARKADDAWDYMLDADKRIGYIRLTAFSRDTAADLKKALEDLKARKLRGLILDLRFNPGGLLTSAIEICDLFIADGRIVSTKGRNTPERTWDAVKPGTFEDFPMVVLVNRYSASASEIVAACLQDHDRAIVIGERSWGKGSVQNVIELESGKSALKLTTASYARPNGHNIHRFPDAKETDEWGVKPNDGYELKLNDTDLAALVSHRRERDIVQAREQAAAGAKKDDEKAGDDKPADKPTDDKAEDKSSSEKKTSDEKPADEKPTDKDAADEKPSAEKSDEKKPDATTSPKYVDRQLQKAIEYLSTELARAP